MWILKQYHFHYSNSCEQYEIVTKFGARNFFILPIWYKRADWVLKVRTNEQINVQSSYF